MLLNANLRGKIKENSYRRQKYKTIYTNRKKNNHEHTGRFNFFKTPKLPLFHLNFSHFWLTISLSFSVWRSLLPLIYFSLFDWKEKTVDKAIIGIFRFFLCFIFLLLLFLTDIEWKKIRMWKRKLKLGLENGCFKKKKK